MEIYLRTFSKEHGITDALVAKGLDEKVLGIKIVVDNTMYYIADDVNGQLNVRTLNGIMLVKPQAENSVRLEGIEFSKGR